MSSYLEEKFLELWREYYPNLPLEREVKVIPKRQFKFDFCHHQSKILIEINGGTWIKSKHSSGTGIKRDYIKNNLALSLGYRTFQLSSEMITREWIDIIASVVLG